MNRIAYQEENGQGDAQPDDNNQCFYQCRFKLPHSHLLSYYPSLFLLSG